MRKLRITIGRVALRVEVHDTPTGDAVLAAAPFEARATTWPGEVYFQVPFRVDAEGDARDVVELGELAFRIEGDAIVVGYGPTPCSEGDEIRLAARANIWGRTADDLSGLKEIEAGQLVKVERLEQDS